MDGVSEVMELLGAHGLFGVVDGGGEVLDIILTGLTKEEEKELLEAWKKDLEADLEDIKRRLEELK